MKQFLRNIVKDLGGNFGVMTALLLPIGVGTAGFAIDFANAVQVRSELQSAADAAALAAASSMAKENGLTDAQAKKQANEYLIAQFAALIDPDGRDGNTAKDIAKNTHSDVVSTGTEATGKTFSVTVRSSYDVPSLGLGSLLLSSIRVSVEASASSSAQKQNALSMYLVLDRSGSMIEYTNTKKPTCSGCWVSYMTKIDALKIAAESLLDTIKEYDPDLKYARLGGVSYNEVMQAPSALAWGTDNLLSYVKALTPFGLTNSVSPCRRLTRLSLTPWKQPTTRTRMARTSQANSSSL